MPRVASCVQKPCSDSHLSYLWSFQQSSMGSHSCSGKRAPALSSGCLALSNTPLSFCHVAWQLVATKLVRLALESSAALASRALTRSGLRGGPHEPSLILNLLLLLLLHLEHTATALPRWCSCCCCACSCCLCSWTTCAQVQVPCSDSTPQHPQQCAAEWMLFCNTAVYQPSH